MPSWLKYLGAVYVSRASCMVVRWIKQSYWPTITSSKVQKSWLWFTCTTWLAYHLFALPVKNSETHSMCSLSWLAPWYWMASSNATKLMSQFSKSENLGDPWYYPTELGSAPWIFVPSGILICMDRCPWQSQSNQWCIWDQWCSFVTHTPGVCNLAQSTGGI